jgi:sugar phosphate permease
VAYRWVILIFGMLAYTTSYFARSNYTGIAKLLSVDFGLDKGAIGTMGSSFLYAYALTQLPWGMASDRWGSRKTVGVGMLFTALTIWGFATSTSFTHLIFWRITDGIAAASVYVVMAGALARWFSPKERGLCQTVYAGIGGAAGDAVANLVLPYVAINIASGWRQSTEIVAAMVAAIAVLCVIFLRSAPPGQEAVQKRPFDWTVVKDSRLWAFTLVYSGSIISLRIFPPWLPLYGADIYISRGLTVEKAVVAATTFFTAYLVGRLIGVPMVGYISDRLRMRGISRSSLAIGFLLLSAALFQIMPLGIRSAGALITIAFVMGVSINMYPLVTTAVSETFGPERTASVMGFLNTFAQLSGATALFVSGHLGMALNSAPGNALGDYRGIWLVGSIGCVGAALAGVLLPRFVTFREPAIQNAAQSASN